MPNYTTINEYNDYLVENQIQINIIDFVKEVNKIKYNIDISFIDEFIELVSNKIIKTLFLLFYRMLYIMIKNNFENFIKNPNKSYKIIKLNIDDNIINILNEINININNIFDYFGESKLLDSNKLKDFLINIGNNNIKDINQLTKFIKKLLLKICNKFNKNFCWLTIRISKNKKIFKENKLLDYDIPRWHIDGKYYNSESIQYKFILTLKGPSTLIINPNNKIRNKFLQILDKDNDIINVRLERNKIVKNESIIKVKTLINGVITMSNNSNLATIHSEPPIHEDRIFISILPMTIDEIDQLKLRWNSK